MYYSKMTGGFYNEAIHRDSIPADAVQITDDLYESLLAAQSLGQQIGADDDGYPVVVPITPEMHEAERSMDARARRDACIASAMWIVERHRGQEQLGLKTSITAEQYTALLTYQQSLRDWPAQPGWPDIDLPTEPNWLLSLKK